RPSPPRSRPFPYTTLFRSGHEKQEASEVSARRMGTNPSARSFRQWYSRAGNLLEHGPARVNQVIADMARNFVLRGLRQRECMIEDRKSTRLNSSHRTISYA